MLLKKKATNKCDVVLDVTNAITLTVKNNSVTIFEEKTLTIDRKSTTKTFTLTTKQLGLNWPDIALHSERRCRSQT